LVRTRRHSTALGVAVTTLTTGVTVEPRRP